MGRVKLEPGIFENGKILAKEDLKKYLRGLIGNPKFGKIRTNKIIFSLPESKGYVLIFDLPEKLSPNKILEFVKLKARENFPHPLEEIYFDYQISDKEVLLIAAPKKIVEDYLEVFRDCNLIPLALEIESLSLARSLIENEKIPILIADIGARTTNLSIFDQGKLRLSFSVPIAGNKFSQVLSEKLNLSKEAVERLKREIGLDPKFQEGRVFLILQKEIQGIIEEAKKILNYFQEKSRLQPASRASEIGKIILAGGSAALPHLPEYLAENLEKEVKIGDPWVKINIDILKKKEYFREAMEVNPILYSTAIGSALRGLSKNLQTAGINLLKGRK